jgi:TonB family protein
MKIASYCQLVWVFFLACALNAATGQTKSLTLVSFATPEYPPMAMAAEIDGRVEVDLALNGEGGVASSKGISGQPILLEGAVKNAATWKFSAPDGRLLADEHVVVTYEFRVAGDPKCYADPVRVVFNSYDHVTISANPVQTCDPRITRRRKHWYYLWL